jgi:hypothetical protein
VKKNSWAGNNVARTWGALEDYFPFPSSFIDLGTFNSGIFLIQLGRKTGEQVSVAVFEIRKGACGVESISPFC